MSTIELGKIHEAAKKRVYVSCDEAHAHTAKCLAGAKDAVIICTLVDEVMRLRHVIQKAADKLDG